MLKKVFRYAVHKLSSKTEDEENAFAIAFGNRKVRGVFSGLGTH